MQLSDISESPVARLPIEGYPHKSPAFVHENARSKSAATFVCRIRRIRGFSSDRNAFLCPVGLHATASGRAERAQADHPRAPVSQRRRRCPQQGERRFHASPQPLIIFLSL